MNRKGALSSIGVVALSLVLIGIAIMLSEKGRGTDIGYIILSERMYNEGVSMERGLASIWDEYSNVNASMTSDSVTISQSLPNDRTNLAVFADEFKLLCEEQFDNVQVNSWPITWYMRSQFRPWNITYMSYWNNNIYVNLTAYEKEEVEITLNTVKNISECNLTKEDGDTQLMYTVTGNASSCSKNTMFNTSGVNRLEINDGGIVMDVNHEILNIQTNYNEISNVTIRIRMRNETDADLQQFINGPIIILSDNNYHIQKVWEIRLK